MFTWKSTGAGLRGGPLADALCRADAVPFAYTEQTGVEVEPPARGGQGKTDYGRFILRVKNTSQAGCDDNPRILIRVFYEQNGLVGYGNPRKVRAPPKPAVRRPKGSPSRHRQCLDRGSAAEQWRLAAAERDLYPGIGNTHGRRPFAISFRW